jgi:tRNA-Thr(GGU) m(6)t(6)A37 methyltransferase TsaA
MPWALIGRDQKRGLMRRAEKPGYRAVRRRKDMMEKWIMRAIGRISSPFQETKQIPKGLGAKHSAEGVLEVCPEFEAGLTDIEGYSHLIILWVFHRSDTFDLLFTPPTDDKPHGVFSTRSPRRPNPIGLTTVELIRREGRFLYLRGVDMLDGTPVIDIKPYTSSVPESQLKRGWLGAAEQRGKET